MEYNALFLGYNSTYINQQKDIIISVLKATTNLKMFGPGYSSKKELQMGLDYWFKTQKKIDILILDPGFLSFNKHISTEDFYRRYFNNSENDYLHFNFKEIVENGESFKDFFQNFRGKKFTFVTWDPYETENELIEYIKATDTFVIDIFGDQLNSSLDELNLSDKELAYFSGKINDNWVQFERDFRHKIISFPHAIYGANFTYIPLNKRKHNFSIIGVLYPERKEVIKFLDFKSRLSLLINRIYKHIVFNYFKKSSLKRLKKRIINYQNLIENSRFCYVSGSALRYPVRKYFEVPSKGTIPIGWRCSGFSNLGFVDGENFLVAENSEILLKQLSINDTETLNQIAKKSQNLIFEKHSDYARIKQFKESLHLIMNNEFNGSYWYNGNYSHY